MKKTAWTSSCVNEVLELGDDADLTHRQSRVFLEGACRGRVPSVRTCVRPAVSALRAAACPSEHASEGGPRTNNDWNFLLDYKLWAACPWRCSLSSCDHRVHTPIRTVLTHYGTSPCGKHAIQISGLYRSPVRPSDRVSGALWFQIAPNGGCVQGPWINLRFLSALTLITCFTTENFLLNFKFKWLRNIISK